MNRRQFLTALTGATAAAAVPWGPMTGPALGDEARIAAAADLTTLVQTLRPGPAGDKGYRPVVTGPGEPHLVRDDLVKAQSGRRTRRRSLVSFVHLTDQHIIDVQSPSRVEFLDRYADDQCSTIPFSSAHRPQEGANARIADAMLQRLRKIKVSPVTGALIAATISTGDNTDNQQRNELDVFMAVMDGRKVTPNSGDPKRYEGVQASGDPAYWHPDPTVDDFYKQRLGFPSKRGWLEDALSSFRAVGTGVPWYTCYGNHDGLAQGNAPVVPAFEIIGTSGVKVVGAPPGPNPCDSFGGLGAIPAGAATIPTTPDEGRRYVSRREWIAGHFEGTGRPLGHGFTKANVDNNLAYYATDVGPLRFIVLDSVNPGGLDSGSIGEAQLSWLEQQLTRAQKQRRLVMLFSHHGLRSMNNPNQATDPLRPENTDLPRRQADAVLARIKPFSCVIAWVNGHTHANIIQPSETFWDIGTAAHIDWPMQSRILDVVDNRDGTLSIFTTMINHEDGAVVSFARELGLNDHQKDGNKGSGKAEDRNTELVLPHPFARLGGGAGGNTDVEVGAGGVGADGDSAGGVGAGGVGATGGGVQPLLPATGGGSALNVGGALAVAAGAGVLRLRNRSPE